MTDDTKRRMAKTIVDLARYSKRMREDPQFAAMREWQEQMRSVIAEAEFEADASETMSTAPASETTTPTPTAPAAPLLAADDDMVRAELRAINREADERGDEYWPSGKKASQLARRRLETRGFSAKRDRVDAIAGEDEFKVKRRPGVH
jgi:hypothetical protein